jgi:hypothetical protein
MPFSSNDNQKAVTDHECACECAAERDVEIIRVQAESIIMVVVGVGVAATPFGLVLVSYFAALQHITVLIDPQLMTYSLVSGGAVVTFLFGNSILKRLTRKDG